MGEREQRGFDEVLAALRSVVDKLESCGRRAFSVGVACVGDPHCHAHRPRCA